MLAVIDIPIGLEEHRYRQADIATRERLGARRVSVGLRVLAVAQRCLGFELLIVRRDNLVLQGSDVDQHGTSPATGRHVEVYVLAPEAAVAVPVDVRPKRTPCQQVPQRSAAYPDL